MFATGNNGMVEVTNSATVILDNTAPIITVVQPTATDYPHSAVLTLDYSANDGAGSGVAAITAITQALERSNVIPARCGCPAPCSRTPSA